jgi:hypothetical protein
MNLKRGLAAGLLLFVAASVAAPIARSWSHKDLILKDLVPPQPDCLVVGYFRAAVRCTACRTLEACSREVVENRFADQSMPGQIRWQAIDYQLPGNEHLLTDYQLLTGGVVLVEFRDGSPRRWKALLQAWNMTGDRAGLSEYLEDQIRDYLATADEEPRP